MPEKILIAATPRSWGTMLQMHFRENIPDCLSLGQPYHGFIADNSPMPFSDLISGIDAVSKFLASMQGIPFVGKIEPYHIYHPETRQFVPLEKFNLKMYSKIYVLDRLDQRKRLASLLWAQESNKWHYFKNDSNIEYQPMVITRDEYQLLSYAEASSILDKFCHSLNLLGIDHERIYTENLDQWFKQNNFNENFSLETRFSNLDYEKLILNLDELYFRYKTIYEAIKF